MTSCDGADGMEEGSVGKVGVGWGKADPISEASAVDHSRDLGYAIEERLDTAGQQ